MTLVIYMGPHEAVQFADTGQVAVRHGKAVDRPDFDELKRRVLDDGTPQWLEFEPEPKRRPVQKARPAGAAQHKQ